MSIYLYLFEHQELRKDGFDLAEARYKELKPILDEVTFALNFAQLLDVYIDF